jgi:hypothetical protein
MLLLAWFGVVVMMAAASVPADLSRLRFRT